jgi:hypothetical protein
MDNRPCDEGVRLVMRASDLVAGPEIGATRAHVDRDGDSFGAKYFDTACGGIDNAFLLL